ncbi:MAG: methyltransferase regulatory domain-containing protein [Acidithiobacillus sp.]
MTSQERTEPEAASSSYDEIPYHSHPFPQSQPARLAAIATLFGLRPPQIPSTRVLELGCASGGNLIPFATLWPDSRCVGVDSSQRQVEDGRAQVAQLGLTNCDLRHASILDITPDWGQFDYIICHDVWSRVPEDIRARILRVCHDNLAPQGVAYVSYNTFPGWHMRGAIRDLMRWHAGALADPQQKAQQARAVLQFLCDSTPAEGDAYGLMLRNEARLLAQQGNDYLLHDYLEDVNHPVYVHEFFAQAAAAGLEYLAEADLPTMLPTGLPQATAQTLARIAPDIVRMEQYLDFLRNRTFRQTLLVHQGQKFNRDLTPERLRPLAFSSAAQPVGVVDIQSTGNAQFALPSGVQIGAMQPITKAALLQLSQSFPQPMTFDALLDAARAALQPISVAVPDAATRPVDEARLGSDLLQLLLSGAIEIWPQIAFPTATDIGATPCAWPLALQQARAIPDGSAGVVTGMRHEGVGLDPFSVRVLALLDGHHDHSAILDGLEPLFAAGTLNVNRDGKPVSDPILRRGMLVTQLGNVLHNMQRFALIMRA